MKGLPSVGRDTGTTGFAGSLPVLALAAALSVASVSVSAFAQNLFPEFGDTGGEDGACNNRLQHTGPFHIVHSEQASIESRKFLENAAKELFSEGGVLDQLGISRPAHILQFVPSNQLAMLATLGRFPVAHWLDGAVISDYQGAAGVLEFVWEGCPACRSYYRDTTPQIEQFGVMTHVAGHNDFSVNSVQQRIRNSDPMKASEEMGDLYALATSGKDRDSVALYYQWLFSISDLQDYWRGTYHSVDELREQIRQYDGKVEPTESVVQLLVAAQREDTPRYQKELLAAYEKSVRGVAAVPPTKIMNEGWATFLQWLLPPYTTFTKTDSWVDLGKLLFAVKPRFDFSNPYWLGFEAWNNFYARFMREPAIAALPTKLSRDRAFVKKAHEMMLHMNDIDFVREALDENWVKRHSLVLARPANYNEMDHSLPHPGNPNYNAQFLVTQTSGREVIDAIASKFADRRRSKPSILGYDVKAGGTQAFAMEHDVFENMPLQLTMAAQNLYIIAQLSQRPASLKTIRVNFEQPRAQIYANRSWGPPQEEFSGYITEKIRIEVDLNGKVQVYLRNEGEDDRTAHTSHGANEVLHEELTAYLQRGVDDYRNDVSVDLDNRGYAEFMERHAKFFAEATDHQISVGMRMLSHNPRAAQALNEFSKFVAKRLKRATKALVDGRLPVHINGTQISFKALPTLPRFVYDQVALKRMKQIDEQKNGGGRGSFITSFSQQNAGNGGSGASSGNATPPSQQDITRQMKAGFLDPFADPGIRRAAEEGIYRTPRKRGDKFWGPQPKDGQGQGDGPADQGPEPGKPGDQPGNQPGKGGSGVIALPQMIFGKLLAEELELPNLKPKTGPTDVSEPVFDGGVRKEEGEILYHRMVADAIAIGTEKLKELGIEDPDLMEAVQEGFKYLGPQNYIVRDRDHEPNPDINAVIVWDRDMSGSMWGDREKRSREYIFYVEALLMAKYPKLVERFVGFSGYAKEFTKEEFFSQFINGGTEYAKGIELAQKILEDYPEASWDRFLFPIGDLEDIDPDSTFKAFERISPMLQYTAVVHTNIPERPIGPNEAPYVALEKKSPYFAFAQVTEDFSSVMKAMRHIFRKK